MSTRSYTCVVVVIAAAAAASAAMRSSRACPCFSLMQVFASKAILNLRHHPRNRTKLYKAELGLKKEDWQVAHPGVPGAGVAAAAAATGADAGAAIMPMHGPTDVTAQAGDTSALDRTSGSVSFFITEGQPRSPGAATEAGTVARTPHGAASTPGAGGAPLASPAPMASPAVSRVSGFREPPTPGAASSHPAAMAFPDTTDDQPYFQSKAAFDAWLADINAEQEEDVTPLLRRPNPADLTRTFKRRPSPTKAPAHIVQSVQAAAAQVDDRGADSLDLSRTLPAVLDDKVLLLFLR